MTPNGTVNRQCSASVIGRDELTTERLRISILIAEEKTELDTAQVLLSISGRCSVRLLVLLVYEDSSRYLFSLHARDLCRRGRTRPP